MFSRNLSGGSTKTKRNLSQDIRTPDKNSNPQTSECKSAASPLESECKESTSNSPVDQPTAQILYCLSRPVFLLSYVHPNKSFEITSNFRYIFEENNSIKNCISEEFKSKLILRNVCCHTFQSGLCLQAQVSQS
jgi:hypothetical protein